MHSQTHPAQNELIQCSQPPLQLFLTVAQVNLRAPFRALPISVLFHSSPTAHRQVNDITIAPLGSGATMVKADSEQRWRLRLLHGINVHVKDVCDLDSEMCCGLAASCKSAECGAPDARVAVTQRLRDISETRRSQLAKTSECLKGGDSDVRVGVHDQLAHLQGERRAAFSQTRQRDQSLSTNLVAVPPQEAHHLTSKWRSVSSQTSASAKGAQTQIVNLSSATVPSVSCLNRVRVRNLFSKVHQQPRRRHCNMRQRKAAKHGSVTRVNQCR